jgi:hypothetical protein
MWKPVFLNSHVCGLCGQPHTADAGLLVKCGLRSCGKRFHMECIKTTHRTVAIKGMGTRFKYDFVENAEHETRLKFNAPTSVLSFDLLMTWTVPRLRKIKAHVLYWEVDRYWEVTASSEG